MSFALVLLGSIATFAAKIAEGNTTHVKSAARTETHHVIAGCMNDGHRCESMRGVEFGTKTPAWHVRRSRVIAKAAIRFATPFLPMAIFLVLASLAAVAITIHERKQNAIHQAKMEEFDRDMERSRIKHEEWWRKFNEGFMNPEQAKERAKRARVLPVRIVH